jgi:hypothetical protein
VRREKAKIEAPIIPVTAARTRMLEAVPNSIERFKSIIKTE